MKFTDRYGNEYEADDKTPVLPRKGAFCIYLYRNEILLNTEDHAPECPELPGGGIDRSESCEEAAAREFWEETGLKAPDLKPDLSWHQEVRYFAEDVGEYWHYHQTYFLFRLEEGSGLYFSGHVINPSGHNCFWMKFEDLVDARIHFIHKSAIMNIYEKHLHERS
jgi:8-oxo-dGTP pyrophosphatase MutT (NUDIX family)